jgi:hypothetical protein
LKLAYYLVKISNTQKIKTLKLFKKKMHEIKCRKQMQYHACKKWNLWENEMRLKRKWEMNYRTKGWWNFLSLKILVIRVNREWKYLYWDLVSLFLSFRKDRYWVSKSRTRMKDGDEFHFWNTYFYLFIISGFIMRQCLWSTTFVYKNLIFWK